MGIPISFTLGFGKHLFHFCFLHYYCLVITRKLCEQLSTYLSNDPTTVKLWLLIQTFGYKKNLPLISANVPSLNKLISQTVWGNSVFRNRWKFDEQTRQENWKAANSNIGKSDNFEDQPIRFEIVQKFINLLVRSVLIHDFLKGTLSYWSFCTSLGLRLDHAQSEIFFPDSASHNFTIHL